jgi:2-C-methyl-D-erythritol 4-phosphate cytidylyltransferase
MSEVSVTAIIVAGGSGQRMGSPVAKQYLPIGGIPILARTLLVFDRCERIAEMVLVVSEKDLAFCRTRIIGAHGLQKPVKIISGGPDRQDSVFNGLAACRQRDGIVAIHDGVRPFVSHRLIHDCIETAQRTGGCIPALRVTETLKRVHRVHQDRYIAETVSRENVWQAQTPQVFRFSLIHLAHRMARRRGFRATDDAELMEKAGYPVSIIPGDLRNMKITTPEDIQLAETILQKWGS